MNTQFRVAVLISGRGSNLEALIKKARNYSIEAIVTDNPNAAGLRFAAEFGIKTHVVNRANFPSVQDFRSALLETLHQINPHLIALAGFMRIIPEAIVNEFYGRMINIHPSLLPNLPGLDTHKRALQDKFKVHGCTAHFVDSGVDSGPIIAQAECEVKPEDTEELLTARVLSKEHLLYPWCVEQIALNNITLDNRVVSVNKEALNEALALQFTVP